MQVGDSGEGLGLLHGHQSSAFQAIWGALWVCWGTPHLLLDVLQQERRGPQVVHGEAEEALNLLLVKVHSDDVGQTCTNRPQGSSHRALGS